MNKNFSYTYLLPLLSEQVNLTKDILVYIHNTYITTNKDATKGKFYLLCKFNYADRKFTELEGQLTSNDLYITSHEINDLILYEFNFPKHFIEDQQYFLQGKYSKFKKDAKTLILEYWTKIYGHIPSFVTTTLLKIKQIFNKSEKLRLKMIEELTDNGKRVFIEKGSELGNKIDEEKETYCFKKEKKMEISLDNIKDVFD